MRKTLLLTLLLSFSLPQMAQKAKSKKEPLFGKKYENVPITSQQLNGATLYLVSGHGGPDPGAIGHYNGKQLHEDEYGLTRYLVGVGINFSKSKKEELLIHDSS